MENIERELAEIENGRTVKATRKDLEAAIIDEARYVFSTNANHAQALYDLRTAINALDHYNDLHDSVTLDRRRNRAVYRKEMVKGLFDKYADDDTVGLGIAIDPSTVRDYLKEN